MNPRLDITKYLNSGVGRAMLTLSAEAEASLERPPRRRHARTGRDPSTRRSAVRRSGACGIDVRDRGDQRLEPARRVVPRSGRQLSAEISGGEKHCRRLSAASSVATTPFPRKADSSWP